MRHEQLRAHGGLDIADAAEVWPQAGAGAAAAGSVALAEVEAALAMPAAAAPDMPAAVGRMIVGVYAALIGVFFLTMARGTEASFMIVVSALYTAIYFAVPALFLRIEGDRSRRPDLSAFLARGIDTWTGHLSGGAALVQILIVPAFLTAGLLAIGLAARWIL